MATTTKKQINSIRQLLDLEVASLSCTSTAGIAYEVNLEAMRSEVNLEAMRSEVNLEAMRSEVNLEAMPSEEPLDDNVEYQEVYGSLDNFLDTLDTEDLAKSSVLPD